MPPVGVVTARGGVIVAAYLSLIAAGFWISRALHDVVASSESMVLASGMIAVGLLAYVVLSAVPFVPGAEIGIGLLMVMGARGALLVYAGMVCALLIAFAAGRFVPIRWIAWLLGAFNLKRAQTLVLKSGEMSYEDRTDFIQTHAPTRWVPFLLRRRYVALALLLNMPGNVVLGGGGGLAFAAGACRLFRTGAFLLTILIAVLPVPLGFLLFGSGGWMLRP